MTLTSQGQLCYSNLRETDTGRRAMGVLRYPLWWPARYCNGYWLGVPAHVSQSSQTLTMKGLQVPRLGSEHNEVSHYYFPIYGALAELYTGLAKFSTESYYSGLKTLKLYINVYFHQRDVRLVTTKVDHFRAYSGIAYTV